MLKWLIGDIRWTPPQWLQRLGLRGAGGAVLLLGVLGIATYAAHTYYQSLPKPPLVVADVQIPALSEVRNESLQPAPLIIDFRVQTDPRLPEAIDVESIAALSLIGEPLIEGITLTPAIDGRWRWLDERRLEFQPDTDWPPDQEYEVAFAQRLFAPNLTLASHEAQFRTRPFTAQVREFVFYQDPEHSDLRKLVATLAFSHPVDPASLEQSLALTLGADPAQALTLDVTYDRHRRQAFVHSQPITLPERETYAQLSVRPALRSAVGSGATAEPLAAQVLVPDVGSYFRISGVESLMVRDAQDDPQQSLTLEFTDAVAADALQANLEAYILPRSLPLGGEQIRNKYWSAAREVTQEVLAQAKPVALTLNPTARGQSRLHSATLDVPAQSALYVRVREGLRSVGDFELTVPSESLVYAPSYPQEAKIAQSGALLPLTGSQTLTFVARGVRTLRVEVGRLLEREVNHLASQTRGDFGSPYFSNYNFDADNITERSTRFIDLNPTHPKEAVYASLDLSGYLPRGGHYFVTVQGWDKQGNYPVGSADKRFVLITNLGLLVKTNADSTHEVFVHAIDTGEPLGNARVQLLGKNGVAVIERRTASDGHVRLPATNGFTREQTPTVFLVRNGDDSVFMPFARSGRRLQYSRFDVGGDYANPRADGAALRAQLFTDRGLYRPGETITFGAIVLREDWEALEQLPVALRVVNPRGQVVLDQRLRLPADGFFDQTLPSEANWSTGRYNASLHLVEDGRVRRVLGSTSARLEEFQPDRLRIRAQIKPVQAAGESVKQAGWLRPQDLECEVQLQNLFGTPAQQRRVSGSLQLRASRLTVGAFPDFVFADPLRTRSGGVDVVNLPLDPTTTDDQGVARLPLDIDQYDDGMYRVRVEAEGFEASAGRSVKAQASVMVSPLDYLVGYKADGDLSYIQRDAQRQVQLLGVDHRAQPIALESLIVSLVQLSKVSTLVKRPNGTFAYQSIEQETELSSRPLSLSSGPNAYLLDTSTSGDFVLRVQDQQGRAYSQIRYSVAGARNLAGDLERNAELDLKLAQQSLDPGQWLELEITAPYSGTGLITIERDQVYAYEWFKTSSNTSVQRIRVPETLEGNAYVNVAFVRDLDSPEVFVSPLSYAVAPFAISRAARTVEVELAVPEIVRPGTPLQIAHRMDKPGRVAVFAVDAGILQVAGYQSPDPLAFFLRKLALQVDTFQLVDLILPEFEQVQQRAAPGGGAARARAGTNLNPFGRTVDAPATYWSGIVTSGPDQQTLTYTVPDHFSGELVVMAVAVADGAVGSTQTRTLARGPFVLTPNVLTAVAPGDEFDVTVGIANNLDGAGADAPITVAVTGSDHLQTVGAAQVELPVSEGAEGVARFRLRAGENLGAANLVFSAAFGDERMTRSASLSVRPAVGFRASVATGIIDGKEHRINLPRRLRPEHASNQVSASTSPLVLTDGLLAYLDAFPHACAEQMVSKVFPQLGLLSRAVSAVDKASVRDAFAATINRLRSRQAPGGGFRFWAGSTEPEQFASIYITHFLTEAREMGLPVPRDMLASAVDFVRQVAGTPVQDLPEQRLRSYAIYVLTRQGQVTTNYLTDQHEQLEQLGSDVWRRDLTAAYLAASYGQLKQADMAGDLVGRYAWGGGDEMTSDFDTRLGRDAQYLYLVARHFPDRAKALDPERVQGLALPVMQGRFNTLSSAYTILALGEYSRVVPDPENVALRVDGVTAAGLINLIQSESTGRSPFAADVSALEFRRDSGPALYYTISQAGFDAVPGTDALAEGIELDRAYLNETGEPVNSAVIGEELMVRLRVRSSGPVRSNVAVVDLLPGGFEVMRDSVREQQGTYAADAIDVREDRVVFYGSFGSAVTELRYRVKLTASGRFGVPAAYAGSMYDRSIQASTASGQFDVAPHP